MLNVIRVVWTIAVAIISIFIFIPVLLILYLTYEINNPELIQIYGLHNRAV